MNAGTLYTIDDDLGDEALADIIALRSTYVALRDIYQLTTDRPDWAAHPNYDALRSQMAGLGVALRDEIDARVLAWLNRMPMEPFRKK